MHSFRSRLTVWLTALTALFLTVFCLVIYFWCRATFLSDLDGDLRAIAQAELTASRNLTHRFELSQALPHDQEAFRVMGLIVAYDGKLLKSTTSEITSLPELPSHDFEKARQGLSPLTNFTLNGEPFRALLIPVSIDSQKVIEILAISQEPYENSMTELKKMLTISLALGILLLAMTSYYVARYLTSPLNEILSQLRFITLSGDHTVKVTGTYQDIEIATLKSQINAMLERLNQSFQTQRRLIADASHELRAPLSNLTLALEICLRHPRDIQEYRETVQACHGEIERLNAMCNALLTLNQSDEDGLELHLESIDLRECLFASQTRHQILAQTRQLTLKVVADEAFIQVDADRIAQVLDNLLSNAIRYSPVGASIQLIGQVLPNESVYEVSVCDCGPGLQPEELDHVFKRFYRTDLSRQRSTGGAGVGLSIAQVLITAHHGTIGVESQPGQGCRFWFQLPMTH